MRSKNMEIYRKFYGVRAVARYSEAEENAEDTQGGDK
jgi:hypothetical protein